MTQSIPRAQCCYSDRSTITISGEALRLNAERDFTWHPNPCCSVTQVAIENILFCPLSCCLQSYSHGCPTIFGSVEPTPFPGEAARFSEVDKRNKIRCEKVKCVVLAPPAFASFCVGMLCRVACIKTRPFLQVVQRASFVPAPPPKMTAKEPGNFATINLGYPPNCARIAQDITPSWRRARHMALTIINDPLAADFYCVQEDWDRHAMQEFISIVSVKYIVIHSVGPSIGGMPAGCAFLSRYPLLDINFRKLGHMVKGHSLPPRGIMSATIATEVGLLTFYNFHLQSNDGHLEAQARARQWADLGTIMQADRARIPALLQIAMGDGNCPRVDMWGFDNTNQMEGQALTMLDKVLKQPFFEDHDRLTGERTQGHAHFLFTDNIRMLWGQKALSYDFSYLPLSKEILTEIFSFFWPESTASWYLGPYYPLPPQIKANLDAERAQYGYPPPTRVGTKGTRERTWGGDTWFDEQPVETALYEVVGVPLNSSLKARVEARRHVTTREIGHLSDHATLQGRFWVEPVKPQGPQVSRSDSD